MKLDNKGWGLQELMVGLGVLFFCLLLIVSLINRNFRELKKTLEKENKNESTETVEQQRPNKEESYSSYQEIERSMKEAALKYKEAIYGDDLQEDDQMTVTLHSLIRNDYLKTIYDIKNKEIVCSGYVTFIKNENEVTYRPYLKCGNKYTTKGYLERLDDNIE